MKHNVDLIERSGKPVRRAWPTAYPTKVEDTMREDGLRFARCIVWGALFEAGISIAAIVVWLSVR